MSVIVSPHSVPIAPCTFSEIPFIILPFNCSVNCPSFGLDCKLHDGRCNDGLVRLLIANT